MNSSWPREIKAVFQKELNVELRTKSGLITAGLFSVVTVVALAIAAYNTRLSGTIAAGMIWVSILFAVIVAIPRIFLSEEELGTMDLLRLTARPHAVYWGKSLFAVSQAVVTGFLLAWMFVAFVGQPVPDPVLFSFSILFGSACLSSAVTLCGALVAQAANRSALAAAIAVPLLLPVVVMAIGATRGALGAGFHQQAVICALGLFGYGVASQAIGPELFAWVWKS
jgi:heme exporter protein B